MMTARFNSPTLAKDPRCVRDPRMGAGTFARATRGDTDPPSADAIPWVENVPSADASPWVESVPSDEAIP